jgi:hypothetical protein
MPILPQQDLITEVPILQNLGLAVSRRLPGVITTNVPIFQTVTGVLVPDPKRLSMSQSVAVGQTISISKIKQVTSAVSVAQTLSRTIERVRNLTSAVTIQQILIGYLDKGVSGNSGGVFVDPAVAAYEAGLTAPTEITLSCVNPDALPDPINLTLNLRKPEFGDADSIDQFRVERNTLGGGLEIYQDRMWPRTEKLELSFVYLPEETAAALLLFLSKTIGQLITLQDQFGRTLTGYITTPFEDILQPKVSGWSASFTFQLWEEPNSASP